MNTKSFMVFSQVIEYVIKYFKWVVIFAAVLIVVSGLFLVRSNEVAVVLRFGRLAGNTLPEQIKKPGLHFAFPFFIDEVIKIPVQTMHEKDVTTHYVADRGPLPLFVNRHGYLLTGDNNVVLLRAKVIYQIHNPVQYAILNSDAVPVLDGVISGELTRMVTKMDIDFVLTTGRSELSSVVLQNSQVLLDDLNTGIKIAAIELTEIIPPYEIVPYFEEVRSASIDKETSIRRARETASSGILSAQAEARAYRQAAISDHNKRVADANDQMAEFYGYFDLYRRNPQLIISGVFRERAAAVIAKSGGSIVLPDNSGLPAIILP